MSILQKAKERVTEAANIARIAVERVFAAAGVLLAIMVLLISVACMTYFARTGGFAGESDWWIAGIMIGVALSFLIASSGVLGTFWDSIKLGIGIMLLPGVIFPLMLVSISIVVMGLSLATGGEISPVSIESIDLEGLRSWIVGFAGFQVAALSLPAFYIVGQIILWISDNVLGRAFDALRRAWDSI